MGILPSRPNPQLARMRRSQSMVSAAVGAGAAQTSKIDMNKRVLAAAVTAAAAAERGARAAVIVNVTSGGYVVAKWKYVFIEGH